MTVSFLGSKKKKPLFGEYRGVVVKSSDELSANRVKVSIDGLTNLIPTDDLPYYRLQTSLSDAPNTNVSIPPVGSSVVVELKGDIYNGIVKSTITNTPPR